jgi:hypothetical protein
MAQCTQFILRVCFFAIAIVTNCAAAERSAPPCRATTQIVSIDPSLSTSVRASTSGAVTGEPTSLEWDIVGRFRNQDAYLVIGTPEAIRFQGDGFIALPPKARAPRSIKSSGDTTRLIIPLTGPLANTKGAAKLLFFESGAKTLSWEIVQLPSGNDSPCPETVVSRGYLTIAVQFGHPQIVTQNRFAEGSPKSTYVSNDDRFLLLEFPDRYQVVDKKTGNLLFDHDGTSPRFSHVGRYVTSFSGSQRLEILDILAQKIIYTSLEIEQGDFGGVIVALWMDYDAMVVFGYGRRAAIGVSLPLIDDRNIFSGEIGCNACNAFGSANLSVDLDRLAVQSAMLEKFQASLVEVADSKSDIQSWDNQKPKDRGPPPRRPKFPVPIFEPIGQAGDQLSIPADAKTQQDKVAWVFSDNIAVAFFDVWNGNVKFKRQLLQSKSEAPRLANGDAAEIIKTHGRIAKRMVEVGGTRVSPKNAFERLADTLLKFNISILSPDLGETFVPQSSNNNDKQVEANLKALRNAMAIASQGRTALILRNQAAKEAHETAYFAKTYGHFKYCPADEGPKEDRPWLREGSTSEEPPIVSANRLDALWKFQTTDGTLFIAQQTDQCSTAPELYGDLISVYVPKNTAQPLQYRRLAASYSVAGIVSDSQGVDRERTNLGASLGLAVGPSLSLSLLNDSFIAVTSKDSGNAAIFEVPSMKLARLIEGMESPLDISTVTMTADTKNVLQINNSGALSFFSRLTARRVLSGRFIDDEVALFDDALNFESTPEGAAYIYVKVPGSTDQYSLDQFSSKLALPGVGRRRLAGEVASPRPPVGITPPFLNVERRDKIYLVSVQSNDKLSTLRVTVDGQIVESIKLSGSSFSGEIVESAVPNGRWINFVAEDRQGLQSVVRSFVLGSTPYSGKLSVLAFGADLFNGGIYKGQSVPDLSFAAADAKRFAEAARQFIAPFYFSYQLVQNDGIKPTREGLLADISKLARETGKEDTLVLFFASHGANTQDGFSLLLPSVEPHGNAIELPFSLISAALKQSKGRIFVFLDACHSAGATQDSGSNQLASTDQNVTIITASKGQQSSLENVAWGGGAFTSALISNLSNSSAALLGRSTPFSIEGLYGNVRRAVTAQTHGQQTPWLRRSSWLGEQSIN